MRNTKQIRVSAAKMPGLSRGSVVSTQDPEGQARLLILAPTIWDSPVWVQVLAGVVWPREGDDVLLGFEDGKRARPIVLGQVARPAAPVTSLDVTLADGSRVMAGNGRIELSDGSGNSVVLDPSGVTIRTAGRLSLEGSVIELQSAVVRASGLLQSDTLITNSVISASYSPGAGNLS